MTKYSVLVRVLDRLRAEAPAAFRSYYPDPADIEGVNAARSKAFVHLFLKVRFGLLTFEERNDFITEGSNDGGIDAYYIDAQSRTIFFIQSKFRQNERNFEAKTIELEELLRMDIDRILDGHTCDSRGTDYNTKVKALIERVRGLDNISRYSYQVIILANASDLTRQKLNVLTGGFPAQVFDHARCYKELLFPLVTATYYTFDDLHIALNLSNKNAGAKISYTVVTEAAKLEITVVFVPTVEIAAAMHKYRNAILRYNPRSYLEHEGHTVNDEIRSSIENRRTNEFALFNNGITILSDGTFLNERIGQKDRAQLTLVNPQIINGGQTAYVLSQIYRDYQEAERAGIFGEKEVLVKIITFDSEDKLPEQRKLDLIDAISRATNSQTVVSNADRRSNEVDLKKLQERCFDSFGIWRERKRGEFMDGVREGYIDPSLIIDRNLFIRAAAMARGNLSQASAKRVFVKSDFGAYVNAPPEQFSRYNLALKVLRWIHEEKEPKRSRIGLEVVSKAYVAMLLLSTKTKENEVDQQLISDCASVTKSHWWGFRQYLQKKYPGGDCWRTSKRQDRYFDLAAYLGKNHGAVLDDVREFFSDPSKYGGETTPPPATNKSPSPQPPAPAEQRDATPNPLQ
jgi:hypothetical protein